MTFQDIKSLSARINRSDLYEVLLGLAKVSGQHCLAKLSFDPSISDIFTVFPEGSRDFNPTHFFVQRRLASGGRLLLRYHFDTPLVEEGLIGFSVSDNGENVPQDIFDTTYDHFRSYVVDRSLFILEEKLSKEY